MRELSCMEASQLAVQAVLANVPSVAWLTTVSRQSFVVDGDVAAAAAALRGAVRDLQASPAKYNSWTELRGDGRDFTLLAVTAIGWLDPTGITLVPEPSDGGRTRVRMVGWASCPSRSQRRRCSTFVSSSCPLRASRGCGRPSSRRRCWRRLLGWSLPR